MGVQKCFRSCRYQNQQFSLVSHLSCLCNTRVAPVSLVLDSCCIRVARVTRVWHSCCKLDYILLLAQEVKML